MHIFNKLRTLLFVMLGFCHYGLAQAESAYNMPIGVTEISRDIYTLHMTIFYICCAIGVLVFGILFYSLIRFRRSKGAVAAHFHENTMLEIVWTVIPFLILIIMAIPATRLLFVMQDYGESELTIKITGYQWRWQYQYLNQGISFFSNLSTPRDEIDGKVPRNANYLREVDRPLVIPVGKKVRFLITSNDVIHAWWVPDFGVKKDAIPGFIQETWTRVEKTGRYVSQCTVLCGANHGYMPIVVDVVSNAEFNKFLADNTPSKHATDATPKIVWNKDQLMKVGKANYEKTCAACHQATGVGMPPTFPALVGSKVATGAVKDHILIVLNGKPGTSMQAFGTQLSNEEIASIVTYERNAWGNADQQKFGKEAGGIVIPDEVKVLKK